MAEVGRPRVFVSFAQADREKVLPALEALREKFNVETVGPFLDRPLDTGWASTVRAALEESVGALVWIGPSLGNSTGAQWEIAEAIKQGNPIVGIRTSPEVKVPAWLRNFDVFDDPDMATARLEKWLTEAA